MRGPPVALTICGRPVKRVVPFLPPPPGVAVGAALSTVGGQATLCFNCADGTHDADALVGAAVAHCNGRGRRPASNLLRFFVRSWRVALRGGPNPAQPVAPAL